MAATPGQLTAPSCTQSAIPEQTTTGACQPHPLLTSGSGSICTGSICTNCVCSFSMSPGLTVFRGLAAPLKSPPAHCHVSNRVMQQQQLHVLLSPVPISHLETAAQQYRNHSKRQVQEKGASYSSNSGSSSPAKTLLHDLLQAADTSSWVKQLRSRRLRSDGNRHKQPQTGTYSCCCCMNTM